MVENLLQAEDAKEHSEDEDEDGDTDRETAASVPTNIEKTH